MVFGGSAFGRYLGLDEVMSVSPPRHVSLLIRREIEAEPVFPSIFPIPHEDTVRQLCVSQEERSHEESSHEDQGWYLDLEFHSLQNCEKQTSIV